MSVFPKIKVFVITASVAIAMMFCVDMPAQEEKPPTKTNTPTLVNRGNDALDIIKDENPLVYVICVGLVIAMSSVLFALRTIYKKNELLLVEKDKLHDDKLKIALSTTETMREAINMVETIQKEITKIGKDDVNRKVTEENIKNALTMMQQDIRELSDEVRRAIK